MILPDYILDDETGVLRRANRQDFLKKEKKIRHSGKNKTAIVCIFFKFSENIRLLVDYISKEKNNKEFDLIIINNSPEIEFDFAHELSIDNMIILFPIANLGTDGGYGLGLEYVIHHGYDYVFLVEDDVVFLDDQVFSSIYKNMNKKNIGFISKVINYPGPHSHYYQIACYPIDFLRICGTIDPRYFTRGGEIERAPRIEKTIKKHGYKKIIINKKYFHPYLKQGNRNYWWIYFVWRNMLWLTKRTTTLSKTNIILLFMYIRSGYAKLFLGKSGNDLKAMYLAIRDFLFADKILDLSLCRIRQLSRPKNRVLKNETALTLPIKEIQDYTRDLFILGGPSPTGLSVSGFINEDLELMNATTQLSAFFRKGMIVSNINSPLYPIAILSKRMIAVDELDILANTAHITIVKNQQKFKIIKVVVALFLGILTFIVTIIFIFAKILSYKIFAKKH